VLGDHQVSLASVIQKETLQADGLAEIVITTHEAKESGVQDAAQQLSELDVVKEVCNLVRIEELA
jgi:homoserine dehydrogenase